MKKKISNYLFVVSILIIPYILSFLSLQINYIIDKLYWPFLRIGITNIYVSGMMVWIFACVMLLCDAMEMRSLKINISNKGKFLGVHFAHIVVYVCMLLMMNLLHLKSNKIIYYILASYHSPFSYMFAMNTVVMIYLMKSAKSNE